MKFPTIKEMAQNVAEKALDEYEYKGKTLRQWIEIIYNSEHGTNLAEVGTDCISREQAIDALERAKQNIHHNIERAIGDAICEVLDTVESGIKQLPPIQPDNNSEIPNNSDCISRQAAIDIFDDYNISVENGDLEAYCRDRKRLCELPPAQPATNCSEFPNNSDTISREAVADAINGIECTRHTTWYEFYQKVMTAVEKLPSAEPEIIRCRECKFASGDSRICMKFDHSPIGELDFCSFAERREVTT